MQQQEILLQAVRLCQMTHLQSTIRLARDSLENPPKITLWMAPILEQASMQMGRASMAGMYLPKMSWSRVMSMHQYCCKGWKRTWLLHLPSSRRSI